MIRKLSLSVLAVTILVAVSFGQQTGGPPPAQPYAISVVSPNGGEKWEAGSSQTITWKLSSPVAPDSIQISLLRKVDPTLPSPSASTNVLVTLIKEIKSEWLWEKVAPIGSDFRIEVKAFFPKQTVKDASNKLFAIVSEKPLAKALTLAPKAVTVAAPNGGELWAIGSSHTITWKLQNIAAPSTPGGSPLTIGIFLSRDGGKTFDEKLATELPLDTKDFNWSKVTDPVSDMCRVKVVVHGLKEGLFEDVSDADFRILNEKDLPTIQTGGQK